MTAHIYILYSTSKDKFYIGSTELEPSERLGLHIEKFYGTSKYTAFTDDWEIYFTHLCLSISQARRIEKHIKQMKSKAYIRNLKKYPEMMNKLLTRFPGSPR